LNKFKDSVTGNVNLHGTCFVVDSDEPKKTMLSIFSQQRADVIDNK
jgi:hypothetical protein